MSVPLASTVAIPMITGRVHNFWTFYRQYTKTAAHTAATAALAIFGILVFVDPWFAALAIASYVAPPVVLYVLAGSPVPEDAQPDERDPKDADVDQRTPPPEPALSEAQTASSGDGRGSRTTIDADFDSVDGESDLESEIGEINSDGDTDTDRRGTDTDSDSADGDTDSDSDGGDTDSDSDDGDTDSDSDDGDTDSDSDDGDTDSDSDG